MSRALLLGCLALACGGTTPTPTPTPTPTAKPECTTACDCSAGRTCHEGKCLSGTEALYCCEACPPQAPAAQACQRRDGTLASCGAH
ncbi:MAG TPA: hypothetical protein VG755_44455 [Nannocystaceae bacterium]|nr:hypothetical protein [Nannocystaceae bacterium]